MGVLDYGNWVYCVPFLVLVSGILLIHKKPNAIVPFELIIGLTWMFAFIWAGYILIIWQYQNAPIILHLELYN